MDEKETVAQVRERMYKQARKDAPAKKDADETARKEEASKEKEKVIVVVPAPPRGDGVRPWVKWTNPDVRYRDEMP